MKDGDSQILAKLEEIRSGGGLGTSVDPSTEISVGSGAIALTAGGTNQNITLTPSGTGVVYSASPIDTVSSFRVATDLEVFANWVSGTPNGAFRGAMFGGSKGGLLPSGGIFGWSSVPFGSSGDVYSNIDIALARNAAGVVEINNGTPGTYRDLIARYTTLNGVGAASTPALNLSGVPFAGTGTTSFPLFYINDANATASTTLNTAGTYFGINGDGSQDLMNLMKDGTSQFKVASDGVVTATGTFQGKTGAAQNPAFSIGLSTNTGFYASGAGTWTWTGANGDYLQITNGGPLTLAGNVLLAWTTTGGSTTASTDVAIARTSAATLKVTDASTGTGTLITKLPTSSAGLAAGTLWNNAGTPAIV